MIKRCKQDRMAFYAKLKELMEIDPLINQNLIMKDNAKGDWYRDFDCKGFYSNYNRRDFYFSCCTTPLDLTKSSARPQLHLTFPDGNYALMEEVEHNLKASVYNVIYKEHQLDEYNRCTLKIFRKYSDDPSVQTIDGEARVLVDIIHNVLQCLIG